HTSSPPAFAIGFGARVASRRCSPTGCPEPGGGSGSEATGRPGNPLLRPQGASCPDVVSRAPGGTHVAGSGGDGSRSGCGRPGGGAWGPRAALLGASGKGVAC